MRADSMVSLRSVRNHVILQTCRRSSEEAAKSLIVNGEPWFEAMTQRQSTTVDRNLTEQVEEKTDKKKVEANDSPRFLCIQDRMMG